MMKRPLLVTWFVVCLLSSPALARTWYVKPDSTGAVACTAVATRNP
jgi:hypothetical protein